MHPRARGLLSDAHALGLRGVRQLECHDLFFIEGQVTNTDLQRLAVELLSDPIAQSSHWRSDNRDGVDSFYAHIVEVALRPGVTDPVAEQIVRGAHVLGIRGVERAATGQRYHVHGGRHPALRARPHRTGLPTSRPSVRQR
ncbi:MAG: hypothetical protein E6J26_10890 [Chloroflexi bacterium]|nr:MAG: hypothetical protein E6J26_10890 [Chloroflexota bacterium]